MASTKKKTKEMPLCAGDWIVEFKVVRRVRVAALDEIDAENEAVKALSAADRDAASDVRIVAGRYEDGQNYIPSDTDRWWAPMHKNR